MLDEDTGGEDTGVGVVAAAAAALKGRAGKSSSSMLNSDSLLLPLLLLDEEFGAGSRSGLRTLYTYGWRLAGGGGDPPL